ncbi:response regulator [Sphingomonas donggukensis]|uniref:Response regulator n=1 Tax=Sphingomonas donggukensis TaxID=2949093 RepID=A0ABY4TZF1_9SPHN|nr:response regulator [Sphingomonas donggukensis]URW76504.1 response regulator [Sphingomonas donggukensis]
MLFGKKERRISRVLVVEDEPLVAFDTEHFLGSEGFEIVGTFDTVADALVTIESAEDIHLVLVDVNLSDGSGVEVARAAHLRGIKVVFVTGQCPGEAQSLAAGCLGKPYPQRDLLAAIAALEKVMDGKVPKRLPPSFTLFLQPA